MAKKKTPSQRKQILESRLKKQRIQSQQKPLSKKQKQQNQKQREQLKKLNQYQKRQEIVQEQRQVKEIQQQKQVQNIQKQQQQKRIRERHITTYQYIQALKERTFNGNNIDETSYPNLIELEEKGYVPAYIGGEEISENVQYVLPGTSMNDPEYKTGNLNLIVLLAMRSYRRGKKNGYEAPPSVTIIQVPAITEKYTFKTKPDDDYETTLEKIKEKTPKFIKEYSNNKMIYIDTLGFYYEE